MLRNDNGNKTRRRKVALVNREKSLKYWNLVLKGLEAEPNEAEKTRADAKVALTVAEITTLKSRIGIIHHD